jgi:iron complex outermembrane receptor protein
MLETAAAVAGLTISFYAFAEDAEAAEASADIHSQEDSFDFENYDMPIDEDDMYESRVVGYRLRPTDEAVGFAETIEVAQQQKSVTDVSEVLSKSVGVQVRTMGGLGAYGAASVRGSTPNQVPVFLDGVQLNIGGFSIVNLGDFSLNTLRSIEVYRGNAPLAVGTSGIGGAIVLKTKIFEKPVIEYTGSYGSWNTWRMLTLYGAQIKNTDVLAVVTGQHSDGDFRYFNRNGTPNNSDDDSFVRRTNNHHTAYSAMLKVSRKWGTAKVLLMDDFFNKTAGLSGIDHMVNKSDAKLDTVRNSVSLRMEKSVGKKSELDLDLSHLLLFERYYDMSGTVGIGHQDNEYRTHGVSFSALAKTNFSDNHITTFRLGERYENYNERRLNLSSEDQQNPSHRVKTEFGVEHEWIPIQKLHIVPTLRGEIHYSYYGGGPTPSLLTDFPETSRTDFFVSPSLGARLEVVEGLILRTNGGRYTRTPDISELFGDRGSVIGNPDLNEEVGYNADAGATYMIAGKSYLDTVRIDAAWFGSWVKDLICLEQNSQSTATPVNIDAAVIQGAEVALRLSMFKLVTLSGNYTYFHGINRSKMEQYRGKMLPGHPKHEAYGRLDLERTFSKWGLGGWFDADYADKAYVGQYNSEDTVTLHFFLGTGIHAEILKAGLTFTFEIKNLLNAMIFKNDAGDWLPMSDYSRYPLPGRTFFGTLNWQLP